MATRPRTRKASGARRQKEGAPPVIEDPKLPRMGEGEVPPRRVDNAIRLMLDEPKPDTGSRKRMVPLRAGTVEPPPPKRGYPEQEPPKPPKGGNTPGSGAGKEKEGYLRLRVLVEGEELSVVGAKFVEGPLVQPSTVHPGLTYEVTLGSRRVAIGGIPDAGVWRSYPDPLGRPGLEGHHIVETSRYEISVRVPADELSVSALPKTRITLYRWRGTNPATLMEGRSVRTQLKKQIDTVAVLDGIRLNRLSKEAQTQLRRALR
jgi:hypothetical protein